MAREMRPKVNPAYRDFLPKRTDEERKILRELIIEDGIRDPIVLTDDGFIVDGHGRWEIAQELKLKVKTFVKEFKNEDAKYAWMAKNQVGKRNLTKEQRDYYMGKQYASAVKSAEHSPPEEEEKVQGNSYPRLSEEIAEEHNVSEKTVRENAKFAAGVDALPPKAKDKVLAGTSELTKKAIIASAPTFCPKCTRLGPIKNCPQCAEIKTSKKTAKPTTDKKPKSGSMKFDWAKAKTERGTVIRHADQIAKGYGLTMHKGDHKIAVDLLGEYVDHMTEWEKTLTKGEKRGEV